MQSVEQTPQDRALLLDDDSKRLQRRLATFQDILSQKEIALRLAEFDDGVEQEIAEIFGSSSEMLEAYTYAKLGEASGWMNLPEEAQEFSPQGSETISFKQRSRVLERCIANLKARRSILLNLNIT